MTKYDVSKTGWKLCRNSVLFLQLSGSLKLSQNEKWWGGKKNLPIDTISALSLPCYNPSSFSSSQDPFWSDSAHLPASSFFPHVYLLTHSGPSFLAVLGVLASTQTGVSRSQGYWDKGQRSMPLGNGVLELSGPDWEWELAHTSHGPGAASKRQDW